MKKYVKQNLYTIEVCVIGRSICSNHAATEILLIIINTAGSKMSKPLDDVMDVLNLFDLMVCTERVFNAKYIATITNNINTCIPNPIPLR